jgi:DnaJ-domain-containing protein 1
MSDFKDRFERKLRANLNVLLDRIREFEEGGGFGEAFREGFDQGFEQIGSDGPQYRKPESGEKTLRQYYANLEVEYGADMETVKESYRRLLRKYHPDRFAADSEMEALATELTQEITRAYRAIESYWEKGSY